MRAGQSLRSGWRVIALAALLLCPADALAASPAGGPGDEPASGHGTVEASAATFLEEKRLTSRSLAARKELPGAKVLPTHPRQQTTDYNCGPAVAQVIINYTRAIESTNNEGGATGENWIAQSTLARWMGTSVLYGTGAPGVLRALNRSGGIRKPFAKWSYALERTGTAKAFHDKVVTDIAVYGMPLAMAVNPHMAKVGIYKLASWPDERPLARHWIAIRGYDGLWGGDAPIVYYSDSSGGYGGGTGNYWDLSVVLHEANQRNRGRIIW